MLRRIPGPLRALLVVAALEAVAWAVVTAPFQGPDEVAHFSYAQYLGETGDRPSFDSGNGIVSSEVGTALKDLNLAPLIGVASARPAWTDADLRNWERLQPNIGPPQRSDAGGPNAVAKNPPLYYGIQALVYRAGLGADLLDRAFVMRLANGALFVLTVALTWLLAAELFRSVLLRTVAAGAVALQPMLAFMGGVVSPDTLLATVWTGFMLAAVRLLRRGPSVPRVLVLLGLCGASLATHGRGTPLAAVLPLVLLLAWVRHRPPLRSAPVLAAIAGVAVGAAAVAWRVASQGGVRSLYGGEVNLGFGIDVREFLSFLWQFYLPKLPFMTPKIGPDYGFRQVFVERYFGGFGSLEVTFSADVVRLVQLAAFAGLVALAIAVVRRRRELVPHWDVLAAIGAVVVVHLLFLHLASYRALAGGGGDPLIVGRYLIPLTAAFGLAVAFVVGSLGRRAAPYAAAVVLGGGILLQLGGMGATLARFYG